jgi:hypothetical protein
MGINTYEVLEAAGTKWNFLKFFPGLVGGHCIGVDPYYLTYKAIRTWFQTRNDFGWTKELMIQWALLFLKISATTHQANKQVAHTKYS